MVCLQYCPLLPDGARLIFFTARFHGIYSRSERADCDSFRMADSSLLFGILQQNTWKIETVGIFYHTGDRTDRIGGYFLLHFAGEFASIYPYLLRTVFLPVSVLIFIYLHFPPVHHQSCRKENPKQGMDSQSLDYRNRRESGSNQNADGKAGCCNGLYGSGMCGYQLGFEPHHQNAGYRRIDCRA